MDSLSFWLCWASSRNLRAAALCAVVAGANAGVLLLVEAAGALPNEGAGVAKAFGNCCWGAGGCCGGADVDNESGLAVEMPPKGVWGCPVPVEPVGRPKVVMMAGYQQTRRDRSGDR